MTLDLHSTTTPAIAEPNPLTDEPAKCTVILVHGFLRTRHDMAFLHAGLARRGYSVISVELPITRGTIADGVVALEQQLDQKQLRGKRIMFVAHSMGGLVVRAFVAHMIKETAFHHSFAPFDISHCVFIGTPHQGTSLANLALHVPGLGRFFKALSDLRPQPDGKWSARLLHSLEGRGVSTEIRIGIIAGTSASILPGRLLIAQTNDGMVPCASAIAPDADAVMLLPFNHVTIHKRDATLTAVAQFLACGQFPPAT